MKVIISATDFSKNGNNAVLYAASLAKEFTSKLILLYVNETFSAIPINTGTQAAAEIQVAEDEKIKDLKGTILRLYPNLSIEAHVLSGKTAANVINDFAKKCLADLIVIGCTRANKLERLIMKTNSSILIRDVPFPVLFIPENAVFESIHRIVFATDMNEDNLKVALSIVTFAKHFDAEISFLYVDEEDLLHSEESIDEMTRKIHSHIHYPKLSGYIVKKSSVRKGVDYFLEKSPAQIIVMYSHDKAGKEASFSKSLTNELSENSKIPLLAVKKGTVSLSQK